MLPSDVILALSSAGTEATSFTHVVSGVNLILPDGQRINNIYAAIDRAEVFHLFVLPHQGRLTHEQYAATDAQILLEKTTGAAHLTFGTGDQTIYVHMRAQDAARFDVLTPSHPIATILDGGTVSLRLATLFPMQHSKTGFTTEGRDTALVTHDEHGPNLISEHGPEAVSPLPSWRRDKDGVEVLVTMSGGVPAVLKIATMDGKPPDWVRKLGPPDVKPLRDLFRDVLWLDPASRIPKFEGGPEKTPTRKTAPPDQKQGRLLSMSDGLQISRPGGDWVTHVSVLVTQDSLLAVDHDRIIALNAPDAEIGREIAKLNRGQISDHSARLDAPALLKDNSGQNSAKPGRAAIISVGEENVTVGATEFAYVKSRAKVSVDDDGNTVLHLSTVEDGGAGNASDDALGTTTDVTGNAHVFVVPDGIAREVWRRQEVTCASNSLSNSGIAERYEHYHEVARRRILFELFNDMLLIEKELNRESPLIELIQRFQARAREDRDVVDKPLMEQVTDRLVSLWLVIPNARRRVNELLFYYPYFLSEEQARFDNPFAAQVRNPLVFDEGLAAQPVRAELSRVMIPLLQGLSELEASLLPVERLLSESKVRNTMQYKAAPYIPLVGQGIVAAAALVVGSPMAFGMLSGAVVSSVAGQLVKASMDDTTTWRQLSAAADRTLPTWTSLSQKTPVLMAEADAVIRRLQSAGMQRTRKLVDGSNLPVPEKRDRLMSVLDQAISEETDAWFREVDPEKGVYPALAASRLSLVTAEAARSTVKRAQLSFVKGSI